MASPDQVTAGHAVYTPLLLAVYDWWVLGFSNRFLWRCASSHLEAMYNRNVSARHLDVGVGTGYFLDKARWPVERPQITLADLNPNSLEAARARIARYDPDIAVANILDPLPLESEFDSVAVCYLLHCLPGPMADKAPVVFQNLHAALADGGRVFGATIVQGNVPRSRPAQALMDLYNRKGIFSNRQDTVEDLTQAIEQRFSDVTVRTQGVVALFEATKQR